ncbi:MAG: glucosamine-6-phosphate deaminase [Rhodobacteraceae bacterium]|nr:glucosamine-6-phosphate deaminase [Paracoccaceae bacterium]MBR9822281.1 glucosamine-6-phosphate deaminase [Paracoccaceae bacterium]
MKILIHDSAEAATSAAAHDILSLVRARPACRLGLATGGTMEPVYAELREAAADTSFRAVTTFNLDEYVGLSPEHPQSYHRYMAQQLFDHIDIDRANTHVPRGDAASPNTEARDYDARIAAGGGLDLQLLGLGANGHIGFNEPFSSLGSRTRVKTLARKTRDDNARLFAEGEVVPTYAITMGVGTIMEARQILLVATGAHKAEAVAAMIEGPVSAACPASVLQFHPRVTVRLDGGAASALKGRDYLDFVHPNAEEVDLG